MGKTYKDTLRLPTTSMPINADLPKHEPEVYKAWEGIFTRMRRDGNDPFILHDGPPYANGDIHIGHALNKILKDFAVKFQYFQGRAVEFIPGWDCHGLPIEQKARQLYPDCKAPFALRQKCRQYAAEQIAAQMAQFKSLGVLADWDRHYETMAPGFETMIYDRLMELIQKGLIVQREKPIYWSWAEQTALAEAEIEYKERTDPAIYVAFPTEYETFPGGFLVWTTTPWTLPANMAVALNPEMTYIAVKCKDYKWPLIIAEGAYDTLLAKGIVEEKRGPGSFKGKDFEGWRVKHPTDQHNGTVKVVMAGFVVANEGSGCVHIAPGHGEEDYQLSVAKKIPMSMPVGPDGNYTETQYAGLHVFDANKRIPNDLKEAGRLVHEEEINHSYPHSWRSGTPVIFRATNQFFLDLDKLRQDTLKAFEGVEFVPEHTRNRMRPMLTTRPDWCLSRQRVWGVPIAVIRNPNSRELATHPDLLKHMRQTLQREGLDSWTIGDGPDERKVEYYNPPAAMFVDNLIFEKVHDILDVWFDSGLTWNILNGKQADLYLEGNDQHRGWFQSSLWLSVALTGRAPYKKVLTHGFVVDQNGEKMSKQKGNVVSPLEITKKYGAEVLRYWVATTDYTKDVPCSEQIIKRAAEGYKKLRNTFRFFVANLQEPPQPITPGELVPADRWIYDKSEEVFAEVHKAFSEYQYHAGMHRLTEYVINDLNGIYLNAAKDRLYCSVGHTRNSAVWVMSKILRSFLGLIAPLFTYTAQEAFSYCPDWWKGEAKDVFDLTYTPLEKLPKYDFCTYLDEPYWKAMLAAFHVEFDAIKTAGKARDTLEVMLELKRGNPPKQHFFAGAEDWFVCSFVTAMPTDWPALAEFTVEGDTYRIVLCQKKKCQRCWKRLADDELCHRCQVAVKG